MAKLLQPGTRVLLPRMVEGGIETAPAETGTVLEHNLRNAVVMVRVDARYVDETEGDDGLREVPRSGVRVLRNVKVTWREAEKLRPTCVSALYDTVHGPHAVQAYMLNCGQLGAVWHEDWDTLRLFVKNQWVPVASVPERVVA